MKYTCEIEINAPLQKVIDLFDNADNLSKWMEGLQSFEHLSGVHGEVGARSMLKFRMGKRELHMIETITVKNLPDEFSGTYEAKGVFNTVKNKFIPVSDTKTKYITEHEFQLTGYMKIIGFLMPAAFKQQSTKYLMAFKYFVEHQE